MLPRRVGQERRLVFKMCWASCTFVLSPAIWGWGLDGGAVNSATAGDSCGVRSEVTGMRVEPKVGM